MLVARSRPTHLAAHAPSTMPWWKGWFSSLRHARVILLSNEDARQLVENVSGFFRTSPNGRRWIAGKGAGGALRAAAMSSKTHPCLPRRITVPEEVQSRPVALPQIDHHNSSRRSLSGHCIRSCPCTLHRLTCISG